MGLCGHALLPGKNALDPQVHGKPLLDHLQIIRSTSPPTKGSPPHKINSTRCRNCSQSQPCHTPEMSTDRVMQKMLKRIAHSRKNLFCIPEGVNFSSNRGTAQRGGATNKKIEAGPVPRTHKFQSGLGTGAKRLSLASSGRGAIRNKSTADS